MSAYCIYITSRKWSLRFKTVSFCKFRSALVISYCLTWYSQIHIYIFIYIYIHIYIFAKWWPYCIMIALLIRNLFLTDFIVFVCFKNTYLYVNITNLLVLEFDLWKFVFLIFIIFAADVVKMAMVRPCNPNVLLLISLFVINIYKRIRNIWFWQYQLFQNSWWCEESNFCSRN